MDAIIPSERTQIIDRGSYYEVTDVYFLDSEYFSNGDDEFKLFTTTVYIRKNATISIGQSYNGEWILQTITETAEECYNKCGKFSTMDNILGIFMVTKFKVDSDGYIVELNDFINHVG